MKKKVKKLCKRSNKWGKVYMDKMLIARQLKGGG